MPTKKDLGKAYDAGQAAQMVGAPDWANPFGNDRPEERQAWADGKAAPLAEKWLPGGRNIYADIQDKVTLADRTET